MKISLSGKQHIHEAKTEVFLDNEDYLCIVQYCIVCGEFLRKRRIKTEPVIALAVDNIKRGW